jgi:Rod binding domain-containing protein
MDGVQDALTAKTADAVSQSSLSQVTRASAAARRGDAERASKMFEELLATLLVREMRHGVEDGFFGKGPGADVYEGWLDQHVGQALARSGSLDLAQSIRVSLDDKSAQAAKEQP